MLNLIDKKWLITISFLVVFITIFSCLLINNFGRIQVYLLPLIERQFTSGLYRVKGLSEEQIVVLTIDDGISARTLEMLDLLDQYNAKATFFIHQKNSQEIKEYSAIIKEIIARGHELGNHTTQDIRSISLSEMEFKQEFTEADLFLRNFEIKPRFFRAAGGYYHRKIMLPYLIAHDYEPQFIMGSFLPWDTFLPYPTIYANQLIKHIFPGAIVVFHDGTQKGENRLTRTFISLETFLQGMQKKDYQIVSLGQSLKIAKLNQ
jgi:peptidoglycan/xylan/chitin deacetylase (PgdA/CDA1 family)